MEAWREELYHHGVQGMKWGVRRFQNEDGTLTSAGKKRYRIAEKRLEKRERYITDQFNVDKMSARLGTSKNILNAAHRDKEVKRVRDLNDAIKSSDKRMVDLGRRTVTQRATIGTLGTLASAGAGFFTAAATTSVAVGLIPAAAIAAGAAYLGYLTKR